jgi:uncharacterized membrane protein (UPF0127 family)
VKRAATNLATRSASLDLSSYGAKVRGLGTALLLAGCDLAGTQRAASGSPTPPALGAAPSAQPLAATVAARPARCVTPLAAAPPPVAAPANHCPADPGAPGALPLGQVRFTDAPSSPRVTVELAQTPAQQARGLMYRTSMDGDHGMLFSWEADAPRSFWMQNTCIPLDMLFIAADGTIAGILEQVPTLNTQPREVPCPVRHVLELNAGWARLHGVAPGQHVDFET